MKTEIVAVNSGGEYLQTALDKIERLAKDKKLSQKEALKLRLLAEEMFTMVRDIAGEFDATFWAEVFGNDYKIVLMADVVEVTENSKNELMKLSTRGEAPRTGIMSMIGSIFELLMKGFEAYNLNSKVPSLQYSELGIEKDAKEANKWALSTYRANVTDDDAIDELEKSIVANIADDIVVSVVDQSVKVEISKAF